MKESAIFLFAGEPSADLHGYKLVQAFKEKFPNTHIYGVGGPKMRAAGLDCILPMEKFQVMGFFDVLPALPRLIRQFLFLRNTLLLKAPDVALFIDYPGFNLALEKSLRKHSFKGLICHYVCPSVWAWGKKRIPKMEKTLDHLFAIFPFEPALFNPEKLKVTYVGNPLVQSISSSAPLNVNPQKRVVALFPGSRKKELARNFPLQLKVAQKLQKKFSDVEFIVSVADPSFTPLLEQMMQSQGFHVRLLPSSQNGTLMNRADFAIAKSGTNNLELAVHTVPTIVTYGVGSVDLFIAKNLLRIFLPYYCIVNIIAGAEVFPELIGPNFTEENLYAHADRFLSSREELNECREKCLNIVKILGDKIPEREITEILKNLITDERRPIQNLYRSS